MVKMKFGKKAVLAGILTAVMIAGSSVTVLAAETLQIPEENSQSVTQQDTEKKVRKDKAAFDGESTSEDGFKKGRHHGKGMISEDGTEEVQKPKRYEKDLTSADGTGEMQKYRHHGKDNSDVQTAEDGTETAGRRLHKKASQRLMKVLKIPKTHN